MAKKKSFDDVMSLFKQKYGDKFDCCGLSKENYVNTSTKIPIICPTHGLFRLSPSRHLSYPLGCPMCGHESGGIKILGKKKPQKKLFGVGVNDDEPHNKNNESVAYRKWRTMLARCYSERYKSKQQTYVDCKVCEEWLLFSSFKKWHEKNYKDGCELDKDILTKGNKVYSPDTCCYIPKFLNTLLLNCRKVRGDLPIGVIRHNDKFVAQMSGYSKGGYDRNCRYSYIGTFDTAEEAFLAYKSVKENYIKKVAQEYFDKGTINEKVYNALINYSVEITD